MTPGVFSATTDDGLTLPIIDVTHPAFAVTATDADLVAMTDQYVRESAHRQEITAPMREALRRSRLGRGLMAASESFLSGMSTYLMKVGPDNLGDGFEPIDRRIAASFPALTARLRLQDMARLLAEGLSAMLAANPRRPLCLINIAGGAAADTWNALMLLRRDRRDLLADRAIALAILDVDGTGPSFGMRAIDALRSTGAPLSGLEIECRSISYDWSAPDQLRTALNECGAAQAVCAASSEGGLFEYGSDAEIIANLEALHASTPGDTIVVGSFTCDGEAVRVTRTASGVSTRPRPLDVVRRMTEQAGWTAHVVLERPFSYHVCLAKVGQGLGGSGRVMV